MSILSSLKYHWNSLGTFGVNLGAEVCPQGSIIIIGAAIFVICSVGESCLCGIVESGVNGDRGQDKDMECQR
jgi:hypothetical protein